MRVVVLGAGALGSIIAAHLLRAGHDVTCIARERRAAMLRDRGLVLTGLAEFTVPVTVTTDPRDIATTDVLIVTVKTYDTEPALATVRHVDASMVLSLQNGVVKNEQLASVFGRERVVGAAATVAGEVLADGAVRFTLNDRLAVGELPQGISDRVTTLAKVLAGAGLRAETVADIQTVEWSKYVMFVSAMAAAALTRLPTAKFLSDPDGARVVTDLMHEMGRMAARLAIPLEDGGMLPIKTLSAAPAADAVKRLQDFGAVLGERAPAHKISTLQDLERGRRLELEETLGHAVRQAAALDLRVPTIETCYRLLAAVDRHLR